MKKLFLPLLVLAVFAACKGNQTTESGIEKDTATVAAPEEVQADLVADSLMNKAARFYAGVSADGINMSAADAQAWKAYSQQIENYRAKSRESHLDPVGNIVATDAKELRESVDYMFYPFAGADFQYPITLFPDADTYFMMGLEPTGSPLGEIVTQSNRYEAYRTALSYYFRCSYYITKDMNNDLHNDEIDGTMPVISMLMALNNCQIVSTQYKKFTAEGAIADSTGHSNLIEIKFFRDATPKHLQTLYFFSTNLDNAHFDAKLQKYLDTELPKHKVASFFKAASYLMHYESFDTIRQNVLKYSDAVLQDDSGIAFKYFDKSKWNFQFYGKYVRPLGCFDKDTFQKDLDSVYRANKTIKPLNFRIGYSRPSNWMIAKRKN